MYNGIGDENCWKSAVCFLSVSRVLGACSSWRCHIWVYNSNVCHANHSASFHVELKQEQCVDCLKSGMCPANLAYCTWLVEGGVTREVTSCWEWINKLTYFLCSLLFHGWWWTLCNALHYIFLKVSSVFFWDRVVCFVFVFSHRYRVCNY